MTVGQATDEALKNLRMSLSRKEMQASIVVRDKGKNQYWTANAIMGERNSEHVEQILMGKLSDQFNEFTTLPNNSTIAFAANWSPCKQCTEGLIPGFVKQISAKQKGIQVKFRFRHYYTDEEWAGAVKKIWGGGQKTGNGTYGANTWDDINSAQSAYNILSDQFGFLSCDVLESAYNEYSGESFETVKYKKTLVIQPADGQKSSTINTEVFLPASPFDEMGI